MGRQFARLHERRSSRLLCQTRFAAERAVSRRTHRAEFEGAQSRRLLKAQGLPPLPLASGISAIIPICLPTVMVLTVILGCLTQMTWAARTIPPSELTRVPNPTRRPALVRDTRVIETLSPEGQDRLTERYTEEAVKFIRKHKNQPFFLYFPHTAVHVPIHPGNKFRGKIHNGIYGDWVEELDWSVGRVLDRCVT